MLLQIGAGNILNTEVVSVEVCWGERYYSIPAAHSVILAPQGSNFTFRVHTRVDVLQFSEVSRVHMWVDVADRLSEHDGLIHYLVDQEGIAAEVAIAQPFGELDEQDVLKIHVRKDMYPKQFMPSPVMTYARYEWRKGATIWRLPIARKLQAETTTRVLSALRLVPGYDEIAPTLEWECRVRGRRMSLELESR